MRLVSGLLLTAIAAPLTAATVPAPPVFPTGTTSDSFYGISVADPYRALENGDDAKGIIKINDWNTLHIIAQGNTLIHVLNGQVTSVVVDDDPKARAMSGLLGFQIHVGPPMKAEFRNIYLKKR